MREHVSWKFSLPNLLWTLINIWNFYQKLYILNSCSILDFQFKILELTHKLITTYVSIYSLYTFEY